MTVFDPHWYRDAIIYQTHVKAYYDANGDGAGDFRGLTAKLDYVQSLGVTAIWILPFYPSPLRDDGYDIADYTSVHPTYGDLADFRAFLAAAHERGLRVITELVLNHTSDQHPWFQRARKAPPGSRYRDYYVWSDTSDRYRDARVIFQDFEPSNWTFDRQAQAYFWHRFYHHQPDLNFEHPEVRENMLAMMDQWLEMGVDALRLDAVPYLFEREGTNCENLPETHDFLKQLRKRVDARFPGRMLLAEANQWPEDAVAYFGDGDECHTAFHFPVMPRLYMALQMEDRFPIIDILDATPAIPDSCQWMLFLRNHDELTLEMVTDEERDYMYRAYARDPQARVNLGIRRRLAPLLGNDRRKIELLNGLLMSLPGSPVIYYGDEIGMGDNIYLGDRNGVRTPMQWSANKNAGFSDANPQRLYLPVITDYEYHYEALNVEAQLNNSASLLWWMRRLIGLRQQRQVFGRGSMHFLYPDNPKVLAFVRKYEGDEVLVVANLSRHSQYVELDMAAWRGATPIELFGQNRFPSIGELPYLLTLGPYAFYWFELRAATADHSEGASVRIDSPAIEVGGDWREIFATSRRVVVGRKLGSFLADRRWFRGKARAIQAVHVVDRVTLETEATEGSSVELVFFQVEYTEGEPERYLAPFSFAEEERAREIESDDPGAVLCRLRLRDAVGEERDGIVYDAMREDAVIQSLLQIVAGERRLPTQLGSLAGRQTSRFAELRGDEPRLPSSVLKVEQSNSAAFLGDRLFMKLFRSLEEGPNPDLEILSFLTDGADGENSAPAIHTPALAGWIEYRHGKGEPSSVAILQEMARTEGDAWRFTLAFAERFFERVLTEFADVEPIDKELPTASIVELAKLEPPPLAENLCGSYLESAALFARRTAEMHLALADGNRFDGGVPAAFASEPFTQHYQRSLYQSMRTLTGRTLRLLRRRQETFPEDVRQLSSMIVDRRDELLACFARLKERKIRTERIRVHGDYHLGQVLFTGRDFLIIDFEGEPARPIGERRLKRSPLRDVAGMLRSFHYAGFEALSSQTAGLVVQPEAAPRHLKWVAFWYAWCSAAFLKEYLKTADGAPFIPSTEKDIALLLDVFLLEKAVYELAYEMNNRPDWVRTPVYGILQLLDASKSSG